MEEFGDNNCYRIASNHEYNTDLEIPENVLFRGFVDFIELAHLIREQKEVSSKEFENLVELNEFVEANKDEIVPLFMKRIDGFVFPVTLLNVTSSIKLKLLYIIK